MSRRPGILAQIDALLGEPSGLRAQIGGYATSGVLQGISIATLIPILRHLIAGHLSPAIGWLGIGVCAFLASSIALTITARRGYRIGVFTIAEGITRRLADHVTRLPLGWFTAGRSGEFSALVADAQAVGSFPAMVLQQTTLALTTPATVVAVVCFIDWRLAPAFLVLVPLGVACYRWILRAQAPARLAESAALAEIAGRVLEFARAQPILRASGTGSKGLARLEDALDRDRATTVRTLNQTSTPMLAYTGVVYLGVSIVILAAAGLAVAGWVDVPALIAVLLLVLRFAEPLALIGPYGTGLQLAATGLQNVRDVIDTPPLPEPGIGISPDGTGLSFEGVRFGYSPEAPVLDGFNLVLEPGTTTALVGPSGAGKSTVLRLAARFWDTDAGVVRVGGVDVRDIATAELMASVSMVFQHVYLFDASIRENVRIARPSASDEEILAAARAARLDEVIDRLPAGWDTQVGEGGDRLSGGERQRVSIARAILKEAPILLLDEITAALDAENEQAVSAAIAELATDKTVIIVAHRLSTIARADRIAFLEHGRVIEEGTHEELIGRAGRYADFWNTRSAASNWQLGAARDAAQSHEEGAS